MSTVGGKFTVEKRNLVTYIEYKHYELLRTLADLHGRSVSAQAAQAIQKEVMMMTHSAMTQQIIQQLDQLPVELQRKVFEFAQALTLSLPKGTPGKNLTRFSGVIEREDIEAMSQAIEADCEQVEPHEW